MLSPDDLSRAGEEVAAVYRKIEDSMVDVLAGLLVSGETRTQTFDTAMQLLTQSAVPRIHEVMERNRAHIDAATRSEVERWLAVSDSDDLSRIKSALGVELPGITTRETASVVQGIAGILARDNLAMEQGAARKFLELSTEAVTRVSSGTMTAHRAWRDAAVKLAGDGVPIVTYRNTETGKVTVENQADVAVRRHVRTQLSQASMSRTLQVCEDAGVRFVEVSSHAGARPTHAEWHGRVYSLDGDVTVDGKKYKDFWTGTGYRGRTGPYTALGDQLGGVNCRHTFGPWLPGTPRAYDPDPEHPSGLSNDEVYDLEQRQRAQERRIRKTKRELMTARKQAKPGNLGDTVSVAKLEEQLQNEQASMRKLIDSAKVENKEVRVLTRSYQSEGVVGYKPGGNIKTSGRTLDEFLHDDKIRASLDSKGITLGAAEAELRVALTKAGVTGADFKHLTTDQQIEIISTGQFHYRARAASTVHNRISHQKQARHIDGTKEHEQYRRQRAARGQSHQSDLCITQDEAQELVRSYAGNGDAWFMSDGRWGKQEMCEAPAVVGVYYDMDNNPHDTRWFKIMYANDNVHIVPVKEPRK